MMAIGTDDEPTGTLFLLYPQAPYVEGFDEPEVVQVSTPRGMVGPGPANDRMYTVFPVGKTLHYGPVEDAPGAVEVNLPPWTGPIRAPAMPDADGDFLHLTPGTDGFEEAHLFASAHFAMDVWEGYFGRPIPWHFRRDYDRLELSILPSLDNAMMGWGYLEAGGTTGPDGEYWPYSLNFDVIAHEIGHAIVYSEVGIPDPGTDAGEYYGFHESAADVVALIASMHFSSVIDDVLERTHGNLYTMNRLSQFAELSGHRQLRLAANADTMGRFARGWTDEHELAQPLTGAMFDILVDVFHERLLVHRLITPEMEDLSDRLEGNPHYAAVMQRKFDIQYARNPEGFRESLLEARDYLGSYLADAWQMLDPDMLSYLGVEHALNLVDRELTGGAFHRIIDGNFRAREIGSVPPGPRLRPAGADSHGASARVFVPER